MPNLTERSKLLKNIYPIYPIYPNTLQTAKQLDLRFVLLQKFNKVHLSMIYMTKPLMAGYISVNGQWLGHYRKQACNKFLQNGEHYLGSSKENTYPDLFKIVSNQSSTSYICRKFKNSYNSRMMKEEKMPSMKCLLSNKRIQKYDHSAFLILAWKKLKVS